MGVGRVKPLISSVTLRVWQIPHCSAGGICFMYHFFFLVVCVGGVNVMDSLGFMGVDAVDSLSMDTF
jgi:hypothetical protein